MALCHCRLRPVPKPLLAVAARCRTRKRYIFMNLLRLCGAAFLVLAPLGCVSALRADSIHRDDDESSLITGAAPELVFDDTPGTHGQAYSFFQDGADFGDLGLIP